ncbi:MAG TPA: F0F1 ATP synthase subunit epsilon [Burkholderiaceae bacterium]|nr:F0F1 ATP synthase subunit epsilon [Burkholderiaceae bacterium]
MNAATLTLRLLDGTSCVDVEDVTSLIAADASGEFGLLPGHAPLVTVLEPGLFRYRTTLHDDWLYGACAGGLLSCLRPPERKTQVCIVSRRFLRGEEPEALQSQLDALLEREGMLRLSTRASRERLDLAFYKRLQELAQMQAPS